MKAQEIERELDIITSMLAVLLGKLEDGQLKAALQLAEDRLHKAYPLLAKQRQRESNGERPQEWLVEPGNKLFDNQRDALIEAERIIWHLGVSSDVPKISADAIATSFTKVSQILCGYRPMGQSETFDCGVMGDVKVIKVEG